MLLPTALVLLSLSNHASFAQTIVPGAWRLTQEGTSGVSAMQLAVVSDSKAIVLDKMERSELLTSTDGGNTSHYAWAAELDLNTKELRALNPVSNTFCATGNFLSNGTFVSTGGNRIQAPGIDLDGRQSIRLFDPCTDGQCDIVEGNHLRTDTERWYPGSVRLEDGTIIIIGGCSENVPINNATINRPSYEFFPPRDIHGSGGRSIPMQFLIDTMNANLFPFVTLLPDGKIFVVSNQAAMIFDWKTNQERRLPGIPNGVRVTYPFSAGAVLLPMTPENNYTAEVLICGGSTLSDTADLATLSAQTPASNQCQRLVLTDEGIAAGWKVEHMPQARVMSNLVLLPDSRVVIVNGAQTGMEAYLNVQDRVGSSNADHPALRGVVYDPYGKAGQRFTSQGIPASKIPRMYHSSATLTPSGSVLIAGSNPNSNFTTETYQTEFRLEWLAPPYITNTRPTFTGLPPAIHYGADFNLNVKLPSGTNFKDVSVSLMDLGFSTHGKTMDTRLVKLVSKVSKDGRSLVITGPPNTFVYPPGPGFIYLVTNRGVSVGKKVFVRAANEAIGT